MIKKQLLFVIIASALYHRVQPLLPTAQRPPAPIAKLALPLALQSVVNAEHLAVGTRVLVGRADRFAHDADGAMLVLLMGNNHYGGGAHPCGFAH